ncbi:MAG: DUF2125 domain-containing protein [Pseudomonadota bacterium]
MKRAAFWLGLVGFVLVAGWTGLWFFLRGELAAVLDVQENQLRAQGDFTVQTREIGGYPFAFRIDYAAPTATFPDGARLALPWLRGEASVFSGGEIRLILPAEIDIDLPDGLDAPATLARQMRLIAQGLTAKMRYAGSGRLDYSVEAERLVLARRSGSTVADVLTEADGVSARLVSDPASPTLEGSLLAALATLAVPAEPGLPPIRATLVDATVALRADRSDTLAVAALLAGTHPVDIRLSAAEIAMEATTAGPGGAGRLSASGVLGELGLALREGTAATAILLSDLVAEYTPQTAGQSLPPFSFEASEIGFLIDMPVQASPEPAPLTLSLALSDFSANDLAWAALDPSAALTRAPLSLALELAADLRLNVDMPAVLQGATPPGQRAFDILEFRLEELGAQGLGVEIVGKGDGALPGPQAQAPRDGRVELIASGLPELAEALETAGLISAQDRLLARSLMTVLTRPDAANGTLVSVIAAGPQGMTINGLPMASLVAAIPSRPAPDTRNAPLPPRASPAPQTTPGPGRPLSEPLPQPLSEPPAIPPASPEP